MNEQTAASVEKLTKALLNQSREGTGFALDFDPVLADTFRLGMEGWKQLGVKCVQRARFTVGSPDNECEAGFALRRQFLYFTTEILNRIESGCFGGMDKVNGPVYAMYASVARRWAEGDVRDSDRKPVGVSFGNRMEALRECGDYDIGVIPPLAHPLTRLVASPFVAASSALDTLDTLSADTETLNFAAYERGQIAALTNRHAEGVEILTRSAANCEKRGDAVGASVCKLQAAFVGFEGRVSPDAAEEFFATWVMEAPVLGRFAHTSPVAKHWLAVNFPQGHVKHLEKMTNHSETLGFLKNEIAGYLDPRPELGI